MEKYGSSNTKKPKLPECPCERKDECKAAHGNLVGCELPDSFDTMEFYEPELHSREAQIRKQYRMKQP